MASVPGLDAHPIPLLQLQEVYSSKPSERLSSPALLPAVYCSPVGMDSHTVCIPTPCAGSGHEDHQSHGPLTFHSPSVLSYARQPIADSPSSLCSSLSHATMTLQCPQPLVYNEPSPQAPWLESKAHGINSSSSIKPLSKRSECRGEGMNTSMHFCAVCHDFATGYHYGVWSCEGCKAFFKRSNQGHKEYICPATNQCTIDKTRRKNCQSCRLLKCYEVGMMKCDARQVCKYQGPRNSRGGLQPRDTSGRGLVRVGHGSRVELRLHLEAPLNQFPQMNHTRYLAMSPEEFICRIMDAEPPVIYLMEAMNKPFTETSLMTSLTNLADKELVLMISWAKKIPGFLQLSVADQIEQLKYCWLEVLMLGLMWRSVDHPGKLIFSPDFKVNREEGHCVEGIVDIFDLLLVTTSRFRELKIQREEYVCLKAMILLNSNLSTSPLQTAEELESRNKLLRLMNLVIDALVWAISRLGLSTQQQRLRLGQLTMLLPHIRNISNKGMAHLLQYTMKKKNVVLMYNLLLEMLGADTSSSSSQSSSSPRPDAYSDQPQYTQPPDSEQTNADVHADVHAGVPPYGPAKVPVPDGYLATQPVQPWPLFQASVPHMQSNY